MSVLMQVYIHKCCTWQCFKFKVYYTQTVSQTNLPDKYLIFGIFADQELCFLSSAYASQIKGYLL